MKKGISLVALIITIIVLIVLTAAVVITGADTPENAQLAVWKNDVSSVQDAVTLTMLNNMAAAATNVSADFDEIKWDGVTSTNEAPVEHEALPLGKKVLAMVGGVASTDYVVDAKGVVYATKAMPGSNPAQYNLAGAATIPASN